MNMTYLNSMILVDETVVYLQRMMKESPVRWEIASNQFLELQNHLEIKYIISLAFSFQYHCNNSHRISDSI